jgi:hypothetical protein
MTFRELQKELPYAVPPGVVVTYLGRSSTRVRQLMDSGDLETVSVFGARFVSVVSVVLRKRKQQAQRKTKP